MVLTAICTCDVCGTSSSDPKGWISADSDLTSSKELLVRVWAGAANEGDALWHVCGLECMHKLVDRLLTEG